MGRFDAKTSYKGQVTIPIEARKALGLPPGGGVQFIVGDDGKVSIVAKRSGLSHLKGVFGPGGATLDVDAAVLETVGRRTAIDRTEDDL
jgi:AbrB family looped-hinge helix DNA binding protein